MHGMETFIKETAHFVALFAESVAILIILAGLIKTTLFYLRSPKPFSFNPEIISTLRTRLGSSLSLSLEFLIGADILKTAISPNWNEIGMLAAIVVIRTILNYFLMQEMQSDIKT